MKSARDIVTLIVFSGILMSCAAVRKATHVELLPSDEILQRVQHRTTAIRTLEADGALTVESPEQSGTVNFDLFLKIPDTLWMKFSGPFGITVGTLMLTPSRFMFYDPFQKQKITGSAKPEILSRILNLSLSFADVVDVITGNFHRVAMEDSVVSNTVSENQYYVLRLDTYGQEGMSAARKEVWVDAETFITTQYAEYDGENHIRVIGQSSRIETVDGIFMPHLIRVILPQKRHSMTLAYRNLQINRPSNNSFSVPSDVEELSVDGQER